MVFLSLPLKKIYSSLKYNLFRESRSFSLLHIGPKLHFIINIYIYICQNIYNLSKFIWKITNENKVINNNILKYIHFSIKFLLQGNTRISGINIAHFQLLLQQTYLFHLYFLLSHLHKSSKAAHFAHTNVYPEKTRGGATIVINIQWRACTVTSEQRAWNSMITNHARRSSNRNPILTLGIECGETCRGSSTEYPLNEINLVIEFQPGEMISIPKPGPEMAWARSSFSRG